jgi:hypothetical protein
MSDQLRLTILDADQADASTVEAKRRQAGPAVQLAPLLIDMGELARLTSLSVRTLRRMDAAEDIPGRVAVGRRVLFKIEIIREWVRAGLPGRDQWAALQKRNGKR